MNESVRQDRKKILEEYLKKEKLKIASEFEKKIEVIPSGSLILNEALGNGGYVRGSIVDIFGQPSGGKSLLTLLAVREVQKMGGIAVIVDAERSYTKSLNWLKTLGINTDELYLIHKRTGEEALDTVYDLIVKNAVDLIVVDSVPALIPQAIIEKQLTESQKIGSLALLMSTALQKLTSVIDDSKVVCIFVNQLRANIDLRSPYVSNTEEATGGYALKFYASVRISVSAIKGSEIYDENGIQIGHRIRFKIVKNKLATPYKTGEFDLYYNKGVDNVKELAELLIKNGIVKQSGPWYFLGEEHKFQGFNKLYDYLKNEEVYNQYLKLLYENTKS